MKKMFTVRKKFTFSASHHLSGLSKEHACSRIHGHNYVVTVEFRKNDINRMPGFVIDFKELDVIKKDLDEHFDHRHLNGILHFNPTIELLAKHFYDRWKPFFPSLHAVEVSEIPKIAGRYEE